MTGLRLYNLFPLLAGSVRQWDRHLERIVQMGFNALYINPYWYPGFSGSLYAIKDPWRLHPLLGEDMAELAEFFTKAHKAGLQVMIDLVINHTAKDSILTERFPHWYAREGDGSIRSPYAVDPDDPSKVTVWGDLGQIDYDREELRAEQADFWAGYVREQLDLGVDGFRCDAAYQVPAPIWKALIDQARSRKPDCVFAAETLGCTTEQVMALDGCGFDYFFNSIKYWDFTAPWLLEQYELYRRIAPTIGFPESHDTPRLRQELADLPPEMQEAQYRFRYLAALFFSTGVMMPMGYEYGFDRPLHVVDTRPEEWDAQLADKPFDLCAFVAEANACKAACGVLNVEGFQAMLTTPGNRPVAMGRFDGDSAEASSKAVLAIYNPDANEQRLEDAGDLLRATGGELKDIQQIYPQPGEPQALLPGQSLMLAPLSVRLFEGTRSGFAEKKMTESTIRRPDVTMSQQRIAIERVTPQVEGGRFPAKDVVGSQVTVEADIFCDGHDVLRAVVVFRHRDDRTWQEAPMAHFDNDRWRGNFPLCKMGLYDFHILAWRDLYAGWRHGVEKKKAAHQTITSELLEGRELVVGTLQKHQATANLVKALCETQDDEALHALLCSDETASAMAAFEERANLSSSDHLGHGFPLQALRHKARFGSWYELFPRSQGGDGKRHGTFDDVIGRLPAIREMGFDVLYFPPIHPIGHTNRKGKNNSLKAEPGDVGSVYAIGDETGGHTAIHPQLGTLDDFRRLVAAAQCHGLEIALDFAIQCSLDHPWIKEHPQWFRWRPDGSIHYAENPPKRYEDIVNVEFYGKAFPDSWLALCDVVRFWIDQGVRIFRVDNPHTKPLPFWEWLLREIHDQRPDVFFLSEAFTRPKMMYRLAKVGFEQSYTYFTWRNTKEEITAYMQELAHGVPRDFFGPNFFVNTPDINPPFLQTGGRPAFLIRLALAGLLCGSWGMYNGFELCEATPIPGREEYLDSEKYELKAWDDDRPGHIKDEITDINRIRRENKALWDHRGVVFYNIWDPNLLSFGRWSADRTNMLLVLVNLDPHQGHGADFEVPLWEWGLADHEAVHVDDLCEQRHFVWQGKVQHIWIDPAPLPYRIYRLTPRLGEGR